MVLQFVNLIITNRMLGAEGRGLFASASTWALGFFTFFFLSINIIYLKKIADQKLDRAILKNGFFTLSVFMALISLLVGLLFYVCLDSNFFRLPFMLFILNMLVVPFMMIQALSLSVFLSANDYKKLNITSIINWAINLLLVVALCFLIEFNPTTLSAITLISWACCGVYCFFACDFSFSLAALKEITKVNFWKELAFLHINSIMTYLMFSLNILIIHRYINNESTGQYFLAASIINYLFIIPGSIQSVLMGSLIEQTEQGKAKLTATFFKGTVLLMLLIVTGVFIFSKQIVEVLGGNTFLSSGRYIELLLPACIFQVAGFIWSSLWNIKGYFKLITKVSIVIVLLSVALDFILIPAIGVMGAIISSTVTCFLAMCVHLWLAIKEFRKVGLSIRELLPRKTDFYTFRNYIKKLY